MIVLGCYVAVVAAARPGGYIAVPIPPLNFLVVPLAFFGVQDLFLVVLVIWDFATRRRIHAVTLWGGLLLIASQPMRLWLSGTECWLGFAAWAVGLVR